MELHVVFLHFVLSVVVELNVIKYEKQPIDV